MKFSPTTLPGPRGVLQFVGANVRIVNSEFSALTGTPYTLVFNNSNVQIDGTNFINNAGSRPCCTLPALLLMMQSCLSAVKCLAHHLQTVLQICLEERNCRIAQENGTEHRHASASF